jgi:hypothetical protein
MLFMLTACISAGKMWSEQNGVVLDEETHQPIEGAIVVARWFGTISAVFDSQTTCYHVESTSTDAQGRYLIPAWTKLPGKVHHSAVNYTVYKAGYRQLAERMPMGGELLQRDTGSLSDRLQYLGKLSGATRCGEPGDSRKQLIPLYRALYAEAKRTAGASPEEKRVIDFLRYELEIIELGYDDATDRHLERYGY